MFEFSGYDLEKNQQNIHQTVINFQKEIKIHLRVNKEQAKRVQELEQQLEQKDQTINNLKDDMKVLHSSPKKLVAVNQNMNLLLTSLNNKCKSRKSSAEKVKKNANSSQQNLQSSSHKAKHLRNISFNIDFQPPKEREPRAPSKKKSTSSTRKHSLSHFIKPINLNLEESFRHFPPSHLYSYLKIKKEQKKLASSPKSSAPEEMKYPVVSILNNISFKNSIQKYPVKYSRVNIEALKRLEPSLRDQERKDRSGSRGQNQHKLSTPSLDQTSSNHCHKKLRSFFNRSSLIPNK